TIFARDAVTYETLRSCAKDLVEIEQDHDTAFNLQRSDLLSYPTPGKYVLYGIRRDEEKTNLLMPDILSYCVDPAFYCRTFKHWVYLHAYSKEIITNRMHSAILGSILGVPTSLLSNAYHKNRSVWEFSLKDRGVKWLENIPSKGFVPVMFKNDYVKNIILGNKFTYLKSLVYGSRYEDFEKLNSFFKK
ncbi:MAG: polysaccharide pyruvyl transferase family protein, partial [Candidatus Omnitrophica bacterium]|nr:polysaccharide pyruvyl transferase family protein [Candidatus Omnitrophota bacterium]